MVRIPVWVKPGSSEDSLAWDAWRERWVVACRAPPVGGKANRAVAVLIAGWLEVPVSSVRWVRAGSSPAKALWADGVTDAEVGLRLRSHLRTARGSERRSARPARNPSG